MKKLLIIVLFSIALLLPVYAQEAKPVEGVNNAAQEGEQENLETEDTVEQPEKKPFTFARQRFEFGFDLGVGLDNGLIGTSDIFTKNIVIDLSKLSNSIGKDGAGLNVGLFGNFFFNLMNIKIKEGVWNFGLSSTADGDINFNIPKSLFTLISEGNINQHSSSGTITASGGIYADAGLSADAKYGKLKVGVRPALYTPLLFIPKKGIEYKINTGETISIEAGGEIIVYGPLLGNNDLQFGFDITMEGEYALFSFLDVGGSLTNIPFAAAQLEKGMRYTLDKNKFNVTVDPLNSGVTSPEIDFQQDTDYKNPVKVYRPFRFDIYGRYKPFSNNFITVKPNIGFSVDGNDQEGFFNIGVEGTLNLKDLFLVRLSTGLLENIWEHKLGLALNLRVFELDLEGSLRSQNFAGTFTGQGFGLNIGMRFGW